MTRNRVLLAVLALVAAGLVAYAILYANAGRSSSANTHREPADGVEGFAVARGYPASASRTYGVSSSGRFA